MLPETNRDRTLREKRQAMRRTTCSLLLAYSLHWSGHKSSRYKESQNSALTKVVNYGDALDEGSSFLSPTTEA